MGGTNYSAQAFTTRSATAAASGTPLFAHAAAYRQNSAVGIHPSLDPKAKNRLGQWIRESRDSDVHPDSKGVAVIFDGTGSMMTLPERFVQKFPNLMTTIVKEGWLKHPHVLFGQVCDHDDPVVFQLGQFEGGNESDVALTNMVLAGGGGGSDYAYEAYDLALYAMWRMAKMDCVEKRGEKGYLFLIGDERPNTVLTAGQINAVFDCGETQDFTVAQLIENVRELFEVFWILPAGTHHYNNPQVTDVLGELFGPNFIRLGEPDGICECISGLIAIEEGKEVHDVVSKVSTMSQDKGATNAATSAIQVYSAAKQTTTLTKKSATASDELPQEASGATRI